ncbi:putative uracil-DNA glycosylase [Monocercomonoides exilis]|uniref:putative uracil-DNA glycosylase n=1 Tax=Monocercomonoides exilis TaxID=2049356 RepID=UPI003559A070|nr:putative uracil-DNA glycosylase [Monocercomonoides exilis]|eukprot:MONOS_5281.1-p1 / transcript=MONOS_5281.1 / gene=MONOS_5281 / organism=Monocercomonoides_exilis_PA203 / gene_product=phage SPO1 DNA polymerase-like protein / transcript_product=phage SPO1 DNA polymerase-like protein / location=Mono_scaffold00152:15663-18307(+) / protein_length=856 / sequence_SO=supercontig / SO=protein_coding / is_pseudo=false
MQQKQQSKEKDASCSSASLDLQNELGFLSRSDKISLLQKIKKECDEDVSLPCREDAKCIVFGTGNPDAKLVFIGEGPGGQEDKTGIPFVGASGKLLHQLLEKLNITTDDIYICNILKCLNGKKKTLSESELMEHAKYLLQQIKVIDPVWLVVMGNYAMKFVLNNFKMDGMAKVKGILAVHGLEHRIKKPYKKTNEPGWVDYFRVFPTLHPAAVLHNSSMRSSLIDDFEIFGKILREEIAQKPIEVSESSFTTPKKRTRTASNDTKSIFSPTSPKSSQTTPTTRKFRLIKDEEGEMKDEQETILQTEKPLKSNQNDSLHNLKSLSNKDKEKTNMSVTTLSLESFTNPFSTLKATPHHLNKEHSISSNPFSEESFSEEKKLIDLNELIPLDDLNVIDSDFDEEMKLPQEQKKEMTYSVSQSSSSNAIVNTTQKDENFIQISEKEQKEQKNEKMDENVQKPTLHSEGSFNKTLVDAAFKPTLHRQSQLLYKQLHNSQAKQLLSNTEIHYDKRIDNTLIDTDKEHFTEQTMKYPTQLDLSLSETVLPADSQQLTSYSSQMPHKLMSEEDKTASSVCKLNTLSPTLHLPSTQSHFMADSEVDFSSPQEKLLLSENKQIFSQAKTDKQIEEIIKMRDQTRNEGNLSSESQETSTLSSPFLSLQTQNHQNELDNSLSQFCNPLLSSAVFVTASHAPQPFASSVPSSLPSSVDVSASESLDQTFMLTPCSPDISSLSPSSSSSSSCLSSFISSSAANTSYSFHEQSFDSFNDSNDHSTILHSLTDESILQEEETAIEGTAPTLVDSCVAIESLSAIQNSSDIPSHNQVTSSSLSPSSQSNISRTPKFQRCSLFSQLYPNRSPKK